MGASLSKNIAVIWFEENIDSVENQKYLKELKKLSNDIKVFKILDEGFDNLYGNNQADNFHIK